MAALGIEAGQPTGSGGYKRRGGIHDGQLLNSALPIMRFTLVYDGPLPSAGKGNCRKEPKQMMRETFHKQLAELWKERRSLSRALEYYQRSPHHHRTIGMFSQEDVVQAVEHTVMEGLSGRRSSTRLEDMSEGVKRGILVPFQRGPYTFIPLATKHYELACDLDILFLRSEAPGALFPNTKGDLDNRLKVLFDALTMPEHENQLMPDAEPDATQNPFFCLLEDDKLITGFKVESERLLDEEPGSNRVQLTIRVTMKTRRVNMVTLELEGD